MGILNKTKKFTLGCIESRIEENNSLYSRFLLGPFERGQGLTLANSLRRTLLSEIYGLALVAIEIEGALHEYSNIPGVQESILDLLLNLKQIVLVSRFDIDQPVFGFLKYKGPGIVTASDLKIPSSIQCGNPQQYIATLSYNGFLSIKFFVCQKKHYFFLKNASLENGKKEKKKKLKKKINIGIEDQQTSNCISIDPNFYLVNKVNYLIENYSLLNASKEQIVLEIWTNGSLNPIQAIHEAVHKIIHLFYPFQKNPVINPARYSFKGIANLKAKANNTLETLTRKELESLIKTLYGINFFSLKLETFTRKELEVFTEKEFEILSKKEFEILKKKTIENLKQENLSNFQKFASLDITNLGLSLRSYNCLKKAKIHTIGNILQNSSEELLLLKNFGPRSLEEVLNLLRQRGFKLRAFAPYKKQ